LVIKIVSLLPLGSGSNLNRFPVLWIPSFLDTILSVYSARGRPGLEQGGETEYKLLTWADRFGLARSECTQTNV